MAYDTHFRMSTELAIAWIALAVSLIGLGVSVFGVMDVREKVKGLIGLERKRAFTRIRNDMVWLFIDRTARAHTPDIAKGLEEFATLSVALYPDQTPDLTNDAINKEALAFANKLVENGFATWKPGFDLAKVQQVLHDWQKAINENRITNILGQKQKEKSLI